MTDLPFEAAKRLSPYIVGLSVYAIIPTRCREPQLNDFCL